MRKYILLSLAIISFFLVNGCDLNSLPLNVPVSMVVNLSGSNNPMTSSGSVNLADYQDLINDNVNRVTYVQAAFRVDSVSDANLTGNITVTVTNNAGFTYSKIFMNVKPAVFKTNPFILDLTGDQIQGLNTYLNGTSNKVFYGSITVNVTSGTPPYFMRAYIDMVFEADTEL